MAGQPWRARRPARGRRRASTLSSATPNPPAPSGYTPSHGEGATKLLEVVVSGATSLEIARDLAKSIAGSSLVKAAIFGADPNWGRVLATVGARAGSQGFEVDPYRAKVTIQDLVVYDGGPAEHDQASLRTRMRQPEVKVVVELVEGAQGATAWGCDLSYDYVKINAEYRT